MRLIPWVLMIVAGLAFTLHGCDELRMSNAAAERPQQITCEALGSNGPGDNAHVVVTDFMIPAGVFVFQGSVDLTYARVWLPIVPYEETEPPGSIYEEALRPHTPTKFAVLLESSLLKDDDAIEDFVQRGTFSGLVINEIDSLDSDTKKLLKEGYPGIDLDSVWIVDHERKPTSRSTALSFLVGGLLAAAAGGWLLVRASQTEKPERPRRRHPRKMGTVARRPRGPDR